jgi:SAM-dependent methyltransferase
MNDWHCPLCGHDGARKLFDSADLTRATSRPFVVVQCRCCDLFSLRPRPQTRELLSLYPQDYEPLWTPLNEETNRLLRWMRRRHWAIRCRLVRCIRPGGGRILDLGCATGLFLHELCRGGQWRGIGLDINEGALAVARRQAVCVLCGEAGGLGLPSAYFDVVTMWDVIEHVPDPVGALAEVYRILRAGGVLLLSTPNCESWQARLWGRHWGGWDVPRHFQVFSSHTLCRLLENSGFEVVGRFSFSMERFYAVESARRYLQGHTGGSVRAILQWLIPLVGMAAWPLFRLIDQVPSASSIVLEARSVPWRTPVGALVQDESNS